MTLSGVTAVIGGVLFMALLGSMMKAGGAICGRVQGWTVPLLILTCAVAFEAAVTACVQLGHLSFRSFPAPM